ncbi:hypothetical protein [Natrarchaeobius oligotrophus]|uniref:Uncharacterized protein n=1 Tax=Natrarchaeobius chitinivorans TaxID=1679083 RepID=A0A3N6MTP8_NATCH|nr:hypothetical protein [Natrarchaeobius chitinivorans]RQG98196.1 hypothetical protein EA472_18720 [Natrarchaeobius chitinivorans]
MIIEDASIDWKEEVANDPQLQVVVDEIPSRDELRFEHEDRIYCAIHDGFVQYYTWSGEGNDGGYAGRCFTIRMVDGGQITLRGPFSSRAGCVNQRSFGPVVDVRLTTDPSTLEQGHTFRSGSLTLEAAKQAIDLVDEDAHLERQLKYSSKEPVWVPVREDGGDGA